MVAIDPTYGMYKVCADINNITYRNVPLSCNFELIVKDLLQKVDANTKVIWLCSPNNPTGNLLNEQEIKTILNAFEGIVVIDEAYIDFSRKESWSRKAEVLKGAGI